MDQDALLHVTEVAAKAGFEPGDLELHGAYRAKLRVPIPDDEALHNRGKLVLVTGMTPGKRNAGKTVTSLGLGMGLARLGRRSITNLRQSALGPTLGAKGGGAGGVAARVEPFVDSLLGLGADMFAVESAHNLLAAVLDDTLHRGGDVDVDSIRWRRVVDIDDRSLRQVRIGFGKGNGPERDSGFDITAASEVMSILALCRDLADLRNRLAAIVPARDSSGRPVTAAELEAAGAMAVLLRDAIAPNLLQSSEGTPVVLHTGPFGNLAAGCSSVVADRISLARAEYVVTEAGFGTDLGAEKFMHLKAPLLGVYPDAAVLVATVGCLREQGGGSTDTPDLTAVMAGMANLKRHLGILSGFGVPTVVAVNRFPDDTTEELDAVMAGAVAEGAVAAVVNEAFLHGGRGAEAMADAVVTAAARSSQCTPLVERDAPVREKVETIATTVYGAAGVDWSEEAHRELKWLDEHGFGHLPVCMAKTHRSLSDNPKLMGAPTGFTVTIGELRLAAGAGYVTALAGDIATMPGMPSQARYREMDIDLDGEVTGLQ
jgi:formate--tetrahydrofolate ligase